MRNDHNIHAKTLDEFEALNQLKGEIKVAFKPI